MTKKPAISIITTSYNGAEFLPKCLDSLLAQTFDDIEIICVDDGSTDDTPKIMRDYQKRDKRVKLVFNKKNSGLSTSRNNALKVATGKYIMFCDSDDYFDEDMCEQMYQAAESSKAGSVESEARIIYQAHHDMKLSDDAYYSLKFDGLQSVSSNTILNTEFNVTTKLFRRDILEKFHLRFPDGLLYEDAFFSPAYFCASSTIYYLNEQLYNYVRRKGSIMSDTWSKEKSKDFSIHYLYIMTQLYDFLQQHDLLERHIDTYWGLFARYSCMAIYNSKTKENRKKAKTEVRAFVQQHQDVLQLANPTTQNDIKNICSARFRPNLSRVKRFMLRFMPTYRLATENIHRIRALDKRLQGSIDELDQVLSKFDS